MRPRSFVVVGMGAAITVAFLFGVAVPGVGHAQMLRCKEKWLYGYDEMALRAAALKVLPKAVRVIVSGTCRNPDWSYGFIETKKVTTAEGVQQWYEFTCRRKTQPWSCDAPEFKKVFRTHLRVEGTSHEIKLAFDGELSLNRALKLANVALEAYRPSEGLLFCGDKETNEPDKKDTWSHPPMPKGRVSIEVSINQESATETVWLEDPSITMDFPTETEPVATCWNVEIVVT